MATRKKASTKKTAPKKSVKKEVVKNAPTPEKEAKTPQKSAQKSSGWFEGKGVEMQQKGFSFQTILAHYFVDNGNKEYAEDLQKVCEEHADLIYARKFKEVFDKI